MTTDQILDELITREGGYSHNSADRGGPTRYGVTAATLGDWRSLGRAATAEEVQALTRTEAKAIYIALYINGPGFDAIADERVRVALIDDGVNSGSTNAIRRLQQVLGLTVDGILGPVTLAAVNAATANGLVTELVKARCVHYGRIVQADATQRRFIVGWLSRALGFLPVVAALIVLLAVTVQAQPVIQGYTLRMFPPGWSTPLVDAPLAVNAIVCGQPKVAGVPVLTQMPARLRFNDWTDATKDCVYTDTANLLRPVTPYWPTNGPWEVSLIARWSTGAKESARMTLSWALAPQPPPLPQMAVTQCRVTLTAPAPDGSAGWRAQFLRDGSVAVGARDPLAPYAGSHLLPVGAHTFSVRWTKADGTTLTVALPDRACP